MLALFLLSVIAGCATQKTYKTLAAVGYTTDAAIKSYFDMVVRKDVSPCSMMKVSLAYTHFQTVYSSAVAMAQNNPQSTATMEVIDASDAVIKTIAEAKQ